jgi:hypothetical protein
MITITPNMKDISVRFIWCVIAAILIGISVYYQIEGVCNCGI